MRPAETIFGAGCLIAAHAWLESLKARGPTVPSRGHYTLKVFVGALWVEFNLKRPAALATIWCPRKKPKRHAPPSLMEFALPLGGYAADRSSPPFMLRLSHTYTISFSRVLYAFAALWMLDVYGVRKQPFAAPVLIANKNGDLTDWASPKSGFSPNGLWLAPIMTLWAEIRPDGGEICFALPPS